MAESSIGDNPILTANSRLARYLLYKHSIQQRKNNKEVWETPKIIDLKSWFKAKWIESFPNRFILSDLQSTKIWESIIEGSLDFTQATNDDNTNSPWNLLNQYSAALSAAKAYRLVKEYKLAIKPGPELTKEENLFIKWMEQYKKILNKYKAIDPADLVDEVRQKMKENHIPVPKTIELTGYEKITPQLKTWLDFLGDQKTQVTLSPGPEKNRDTELKVIAQGKDVKLYKFYDYKEEIINCARWVRSIFKKDKSIGIVVPEIAYYRQTLHKELSANLAPMSIFPWEEVELPFDISLGTPLANEPMVQVALEILSIPEDEISVDIFFHISKSQYLFSSRRNSSAISDLETILRDKHLTIIDLDSLYSFINAESAPDLNNLISYLITLSKSIDTQLPSVWAKLFAQTLKNLGWICQPEMNYSSREIQCLNTWNECLDDLASLDSFTEKISRNKAAKELRRIALEKLFQIKTKEQPIKALGILESAGLTFDYLWVMGIHSDCLPDQPSPNPFISLSLQKDEELPHSDPKIEYEFAKKQIGRLLRSSENIIFSYPKQTNDKDARINPLLSSLSLTETTPSLDKSHRAKDLMKPSINLELWEDKTNVQLSPQEFIRFTEKGISNGYKVIKDQSDCPFKSFATNRLNSSVIQTSSIDFGPRERGILIHKALQLFWKKHKTREALQCLKTNRLLEEEINKITRSAMKTNDENLIKQPYFKMMEEQRTVSVLSDWMNEELLRPDFEVSYQEKSEFMIIDKLKLKIIIDRIDVTPEGNVIIIDYKTGSIKPSDWFPKRTQDPQLPLYASKLLPSGIAFACIKKGDLKWITLLDKTSSVIKFGNTPQKIPKETGWPEWEKTMNYWKTNLNEIAKEFMSGKVLIDPYKNMTTCSNCNYQTLCRIGEGNGRYESWETLE